MSLAGIGEAAVDKIGRRGSRAGGALSVLDDLHDLRLPTKQRGTGGCILADIMHICEIVRRAPEIRLGKLSKAGQKILRNAPPAFSREICATEMTRKAPARCAIYRIGAPARLCSGIALMAG